jgi:rhodanese-related sulfurtransferase
MTTVLNGLFLLLAVWFVFQRLTPVKGIRSITTSELKAELHQKGKQLVDVRTPAGFKANHIRGFKNIPLYELQQRARELSKEKEVIVICQSGLRSAKASKVLKKLGFKQIMNVKGGMSAWQ